MLSHLESDLVDVRTSRTKLLRPDQHTTIEPSPDSPDHEAESDGVAKDHHARESHDDTHQSSMSLGSQIELKLPDVDISKQSPQNISLSGANTQNEHYTSTATKPTIDDNESTSFMSDDEKMSEFDFDGTNYVQSPLKPSTKQEEPASSIISNPKESKSDVLYGRYSIGLDDSMIDKVCSHFYCHTPYNIAMLTKDSSFRWFHP